MNVYDGFLREISPENWEFFAVDFLFSIGFTIRTSPSRGPDGGKDFLVENSGLIYLVSCKHYINSGKSVGVSDEQSITDRLKQHGAQGFIGFYSTTISSSLQGRLESFATNGNPYLIFDQSSICNYLPRINSLILQKYGLPNGIRFVMNVDKNHYAPLPCMRCSVDILDDTMINRSLALITVKNNELKYIYGCKKCFGSSKDRGWIEVSQSLHQEQLNGWIRYVNNYLKTTNPASDFYQRRSEYESAIQQKMYPSNWGQWLA